MADYSEPEGFDFDENTEFLVDDIERFTVYILQSASIDADLTMAGYKPDDPMKMELFEEAMEYPYDPARDYEFVPPHELQHLMHQNLRYQEDGKIMTSATEVMECSKAVAKRIISTTFEMAAKEGLLEPVITSDGKLEYIAKGNKK